MALVLEQAPDVAAVQTILDEICNGKYNWASNFWPSVVDSAGMYVASGRKTGDPNTARLQSQVF